MKTNNKRCYTVYMHIFPDDKVYVGLTKHNIKERWGSNGVGYKTQPVYEPIKNFGWNNIKHLIVAENLTYIEAQELEKEYILKFDSIKNGYNVYEGGGLGGHSWITFEYNGKIYTAKELADMSLKEITAHDITTRVNHHGWSLEEAMNKPKMKKDYVYEYQNDFYTVSELVRFIKADGLNKKHLYTRLNKYNWDVERALTQPLNVKKQPKGIGERIYEYNGKMYNSYELSQISNVDGLTPFDITNRINKHKWSVDKAITQPKKKMNQKFEYNGKLYTSKELASISTVEGLTHNDITDRINRSHWSVEDAITKPKANKSLINMHANQKPSL